MKEIIVRIKRCSDEEVAVACKSLKFKKIFDGWKKQGLRDVFDIAWGENDSVYANENCKLKLIIRHVKDSEGEI